jgi:sialic acid synthase SpsE
MNFRKIFSKKDPIVVAEIGNNHEGNFDRAIKLIDAAVDSGASAVKFQTYKLESYYNEKYTDKKRFKRLKKFQLSFEQFKKLSIYSIKKNIVFFSTPFDLESAFFLNKIQRLFKISSGDNNFLPLIKLVKTFNKPVILSTGLMEYSEIKRVAAEFSNYAYKNKLAILHCISKYPALNKDLNLNSIKFLKQKFPQFEIGYSDHSINDDTCKIALTLGSFIVEKHFTLNKNTSSFHDHKISATPDELNSLVEFSKNVRLILGKLKKIPDRSEKKNIVNLRRSPYINKDIKKNQKINNDDIIWLRPFKKNSLNKIKILTSTTSKKNLKKGDLLIKKNLK